MQKGKVLIIFDVYQLDCFHEISRLKVREESHDESVLGVGVDVEDADEVLHDLVGRGQQQMWGEQSNHLLELGIHLLESVSCLSSSIEAQALLVEDVILEGLKIAVQIWRLRLQLLETLLGQKIECLIVNIGCLLDVKEKGQLAPRRRVDLVQLPDFEATELLGET